jgi:outer membrane protein OmpA-like peptidoglycan-associated protein
MAINDDKYSIRLENSVLPKVSSGPRYGYILAAVAIVLILGIAFNSSRNGKDVPAPPNGVTKKIPVVDTAPEQPVVDTAPEQPVVDTAPEQPVVDTAPEQPVVDTAPEQPVVDTAPEQPVVDTAPEQPVVDTAPEDVNPDPSALAPQKKDEGNKELDNLPLTKEPGKIILPISVVITFDFDKSKISSNQSEILIEYIQKINCRKGKFNLEGHADSIGSEDYNMNLSRQRALNVKRYIEKQGCRGVQRIESKAFGETRFVASNNIEKERRKNRRVVIEFTPSY